MRGGAATQEGLDPFISIFLSLAYRLFGEPYVNKALNLRYEAIRIPREQRKGKRYSSQLVTLSPVGFKMAALSFED
ncbi:hypothetical protein TNCV_2932671 [Trichonephila clavipes]|nr:hypothetical protein TNCV_2932671 [Trichonephila clavipes]